MLASKRINDLSKFVTNSGLTIDLPCLNRIDRILLINPMVITPCSPLHKKAAG
jgi:hypothetical protein